MSYQALEITWLSSALLFVLAQAVMAIALAYSGPDLDKAIEHYKLVRIPLHIMLWVGYLSLLSAVIVSWVYFSLQSGCAIGGYIVSCVITTLVIIAIITSYILMRRVWQIRFKPDFSDYSILT